MITGAALVIILCGIIFGTLKAVDIIKYGTGNGVTTVGKQSISEKMKTIEKLIDENAYFDIDPEKVESGIYKGLVSGLDDDYAAYMTPDEQRMESEQVQGEYRGMGITMSYKQASGSEIQSVYEGSPAERVGLKAKDVITEADGVSYVEKSTTELAYYVRTSEKESVNITVYRPSTKETLKFEVPLEKVLHLKTGVNYLEHNNMLVAGEFITKPEFEQYNKVVVPEEEAYGANCIWMNETVIVPEGYPSVLKAVQDLGYETLIVDTSEFRKIDGGLSCLSLRFWA